MSAHAPWKDLERRHAKRMGGKRLWRPDFSDSQPDGETARDTWDTKCYQRFSVIGLFVAAERKYREFNKGRRFHLCLFDRSRRGAGDFVLIRADDFAELERKERRLEKLEVDYLVPLPDGCEYPDCTPPQAPDPDFDADREGYA